MSPVSSSRISIYQFRISIKHFRGIYQTFNIASINNKSARWNSDALIAFYHYEQSMRFDSHDSDYIQKYSVVKKQNCLQASPEAISLSLQRKKVFLKISRPVPCPILKRKILRRIARETLSGISHYSPIRLPVNRQLQTVPVHWLTCQRQGQANDRKRQPFAGLYARRS